MGGSITGRKRRDHLFDGKMSLETWTSMKFFRKMIHITVIIFISALMLYEALIAFSTLYFCPWRLLLAARCSNAVNNVQK